MPGQICEPELINRNCSCPFHSAAVQQSPELHRQDGNSRVLEKSSVFCTVLLGKKKKKPRKTNTSFQR